MCRHCLSAGDTVISKTDKNSLSLWSRQTTNRSMSPNLVYLINAMKKNREEGRKSGRGGGDNMHGGNERRPSEQGFKDC